MNFSLSFFNLETLSLPHVDDDDRRDFKNARIAFTIHSGSTSLDIDIIIDDDVNEAEEQLILVLEINDSANSEIDLDRHRGVLVLTIRDDDSEV